MPDFVDFVTRFAEEELLGWGAPGLALGVARRGEPLHTGGHGLRDAQRELPCTAETLFPLGSITKVFTAVAVMQLAEQGRLRLGAPVREYLPEFRLGAGTDRITIQHLLTHTSGLAPTAGLYAALKENLIDLRAVPVDLDALPVIRTYGDLLDYLAETTGPPLGEPGAHFSYSNDGFALLGAIVERASGSPYCDYVTEQVLRPAGMLRTSWSPALEEEQAVRYRVGPDGRPEPTGHGWFTNVYRPAAHLWSSVTEMLRFLELFRTGGRVGQERLLTAASLAAMMRPHTQCHPTMWYGYGLFVTPRYHDVTLVEHGGNTQGGSAQVTCVPEQGITAVALSNGTGVPVPQVLLGAVNAVLGLPLKASRVDLPSLPAPADQLPYTGTYISDEGRRVKATLTDTGLVVEMGPSRFPARYVGDNAFLFHWPLLGYETPIQFELDANGRAIRARVSFRTMYRANPSEE